MQRLAIFVLVAVVGCSGPEESRRGKRPESHATPIPAPAAVRIISGLDGPESALYDAEADVYYISNVAGDLLGRDNNGFITRVDARTMATERMWIAGGQRGVTLHAPKGMAIIGGTLYVSDVTGVRKFDRRSGAPLAEIPLPGATLINDIATDGSNLYVSDTGVRPSTGVTFQATGTDAVWTITNDVARKTASGRALDQPNGLAWADGQLWVATFRGHEVYRLNNGRKADVIQLPQGQLDGLVHLGSDHFLVTSWQGMNIYNVVGGRVALFLAGIAAPADIGHDTKRQLLLVPRSTTNEVTIHPLPSTPSRT